MRWTNQELDAVRLYRGTGCKACEQTGYLGRIGIFEGLVLDARIREAILRRASSDEIMERAAAGGMTTMFEDGIDKAWQGLTTLAEVLRVASGEYPGSS
jgi:type IV pilus assembly protein PilB